MASLKVAAFQLFICFLLRTSCTDGKLACAIRDGRSAVYNEFPYQVSLQMNGVHMCGGSIIDSTHILTAAHCVENELANYMSVVTSTRNLSLRGKRYYVKSITSHPMYISGDKNSWKNDISVIALNDTIKFDRKTRTINLPTRNIAANEIAVASGWGDLYFGGSTPSSLKKLEMKILSNRHCRLSGITPLFDTQICAIGHKGSGVCTGDSGGPLVSKGTLVGVASFIIPCGKGYPDVFTRVYSYVNWIRQVVQSS